ncbi:MAG TPA: thioredoxin [Longimicrobiales bacterium]|nr:thioredoxin [Longimicrobiales bacterium]
MATNENVLKVTDSNFATEIVGNQGLTMVDFWAEWCGPCKIVAPSVDQLADEYKGKGLKVAKVDVDTNPATASQFGIRSIPTILFFKGGKVVDQVIGAVPKGALEQKIQQHI